MYGTTVAAAATAKVTGAAGRAHRSARSPRWSRRACWPISRTRTRQVLAALDTRAALDADINHLMAAIPALARTLRYGDVRRTDVAGLSTRPTVRAAWARRR